MPTDENAIHPNIAEQRKEPATIYPFFLGLYLVCGCTLMYEIVLTRLLIVISWYYVAFVSISMAMFGMTLGALFVQLWPEKFPEAQVPHRLAQASSAMAMSVRLVLLTMLY